MPTIPVHRDALLDLLARGEALDLDLSGVSAADVSLVQLLVAARSASERRDLPFRVTAASDAVRAAFVSAGIPWSAVAAPSSET